jgi:hypothetical protein
MFKVVSTLNIQTLRRHYFTDLAQLTSHSPPSPPSSPPRAAGVQPTDGALLGLQPPPTAAARAERTPRDAYGAPVPARAVGMAVSHPQSPLTAPDAPEAPETCERTKPRHGQMMGQLPPKFHPAPIRHSG